MSKRLIKIAKELNVGTGTLVDFLNSNGFDVDNKPTTKVTPEMQEVLLKEFARDKEVKQQADQRVIGIRHEEKEEVSNPIETPKIPKAPVAKEKPKVVEAKPEPPVEKPAPKVEAKPTEPIVEKPIIEQKKEESPKVEETPKVQETPKVEEPPKLEDTPSEKPSVGGLKILGKIDLDKTAKKPKKSSSKNNPSKKEEPKKVTPKAEDKKVEPVKKEETPVVNKKEDTPKPAKQKEEAPKPEVKKAPEPKAKENMPKAKPAANTSSPENIISPIDSPPPKDEDIIKARATKLTGPKILGKIVLETKPKKSDKKTDNKDGDKKNVQSRQKRKRKTVAVNKPKQGQDNRSNNNRPNNRPNNNNNNNSRRRDDRNNKKRPTKKDEIKEVSQKEIDDKIKATMDRLSGGGKKKRQKLRREHREKVREKQEARETENENDKLQLTEFISVSELAGLMDVQATEVITTCMNLGVFVAINQRLEADIIELVASEFGHEIEFISAEESIAEEEEAPDDPADLVPRAPIVTVMGHVDHGKTSLLDYIRTSTVADGEAGGITQHIGAYEVITETNKKLTFLDTPGHEAFTAMRARGAKITDIAIIIISADDSIMPQTKEAISHAQAAEVPIIFAINKIDKDGANPERIKQELASMNLLIEEWGGKYQSQEISAKNGTNIDLLLEKVLLEAELLELKANPKRNATGTIIEAALDKGRGYTAKFLVQNGTLNISDNIVAGEYYGKVKAMFNERGVRIKSAGPSTPVLVLGLGGAPQAGEKFKETEKEQEAKGIALKRSQISREQSNRANKRVSLEEMSRRLALGSFKELNLIVKGDFDGSVEALSDSFIKLSQDTVKVNVIHKAVGQIIESDILLASASDAIIIGFQVRPSLNARRLAEQEGIQIKTYSVIYEAIDEISDAIEGMLEPTKEEKITGNIEIRETFKVSKVGTIAGCYVLDGKVARNDFIRIIRDGIVVYPVKANTVGELASLKRYKDDIKEVKNGFECGLAIKNFNDIKVGDVIEAYEIVEVKQKMNI